MNAIQRVTANLSRDLLRDARAVTGKGITETLTEGLNLLKRRRAAMKAKRLRGKLRLEVDLDVSRERHRH